MNGGVKAEAGLRNGRNDSSFLAGDDLERSTAAASKLVISYVLVLVCVSRPEATRRKLRKARGTGCVGSVAIQPTKYSLLITQVSMLKVHLPPNKKSLPTQARRLPSPFPYIT